MRRRGNDKVERLHKYDWGEKGWCSEMPRGPLIRMRRSILVEKKGEKGSMTDRTHASRKV